MTVVIFLQIVVGIAVASMVAAIAAWQIDKKEKVIIVPIPKDWIIEALKTDIVLLRAERILGNVQVAY